MAFGSLELGVPSRTGIRSSESTERILAILRKWGVRTLGQLAALDKEDLRNRLGNEAVRLWERANGTAPRPLKFVQPPEIFSESFEFDHEIETAEPLLFILRRFLEQLALRLSSIYLVARELTLTIAFSNKKTHIRVFKIPQPTVEVDLLFRMLQTHLEDFKSEYPIVAVALSAEPIRPASQQFGLFETALRNPQQLYETLARLSALLGNDRVGTPMLEETHRPDAFRMEPFEWVSSADASQTSNPSSSPSPQNGEKGLAGASPSRTGSIVGETPATTENKCGGHRPPLQEKPALRRFRPPANTSVFVSDQRYLQSDKVRGQILNQSGPFLFSGNWWDEKSWARAEWDLQLESGELVRAHESPPSKEASPARTYGVTDSAGGVWKLDGIYD